MMHRLKLIAAALPTAVVCSPVGIGLSAALAQDAIAAAPLARHYESPITVQADETAADLLTKRKKILTRSTIATLSQQKLTFVADVGRQTEDIEATFAPLPPVAIDNAALRFESVAKAEGRTFWIDREYVPRVAYRRLADFERTITADREHTKVNISSSSAFAAGAASAAVGSVDAPSAAAAPEPPAKPNPVVAQNVPAAPSAPPAQNAMLAAPSPIELKRVAAAGQKIRLEFLFTIDPDCSSVGQTVVRILEPPQHGKLTVENGQGFPFFAKDNPRSDCNTRKSEGTYVFYEAEAGYEGNESTTLDIIFPNGVDSKRRYAIEVR
jgi:hypothetical protein